MKRKRLYKCHFLVDDGKPPLFLTPHLALVIVARVAGIGVVWCGVV